jgi:hypothetical protein
LEPDSGASTNVLGKNMENEIMAINKNTNYVKVLFKRNENSQLIIKDRTHNKTIF